MQFNNIIIIISLVVMCYLIGSIPVGSIYARIKGVNINEIGSKSSGATNIGRQFGFKGFIIVFVLDILKGFLAFSISETFLQTFGSINSQIMFYSILMGLGIVAVVGHSYSCFNKFKGGKGVATSLGVLVAYCFPIAILALISFLIVYKIKKTVSLASLSAFVVSTILSGLALIFGDLSFFLPLFIGSIIATTWVFFTHRDNIKRLIKGEEHSFKK